MFALGFCGLFTALAVLIGPKVSNPDKLKPFECGSEPIGSPRGRYSVKFYQVAILFLVFDIEAAFMYPCAVLYNQLSRTIIRSSTSRRSSCATKSISQAPKIGSTLCARCSATSSRFTSSRRSTEPDWKTFVPRFTNFSR